MSIGLLPRFIRDNYEVHEWKHACAVLHEDFPIEGGGGGGCPLLVFGISKRLYVEDDE